jgi:hypothetical protein
MIELEKKEKNPPLHQNIQWRRMGREEKDSGVG